jgi:hypothetical protein
MDVQTREGIFGGGAYGGGVFDGSNMGFGALGGLGVFPPPSKYPAGYPSPTYTAKAGETGTTIARDITGNGNRWTELVTANPETKDATIGMRFNPGKSLKLPTSWVAAAGVTATPDSPTSIAPAPGTAASATAVTSTSASSPAESGMSTGMVVAGLVGVAVIAGIFIMRNK